MSVTWKTKLCAALVNRNLYIIHVCIDHDLVSLARIVSVCSDKSDVSGLEERVIISFPAVAAIESAVIWNFQGDMLACR